MNNTQVNLSNAMSGFIQRKINSSVATAKIGNVVSFSAGVDLIVRVSNVKDQNILLSFSEGILLILSGHSFTAGDDVVLLPVSGKWLVLELASSI